MRRALSLSLPRWPVDCARRRARSRTGAGRSAPRSDAYVPQPGGHGPRDGPAALLLTALVGGRQVVAARCDAARAVGVRPGHGVAEARARLSGRPVETIRHEPLRDVAALRALAGWALRFAPTVALDPPSGLLLDVSGCERLFAGEARLVRLLLDALSRLGIAARAAVAGTWGCAWALARFSRATPVAVAVGDEGRVLGPLPVAALRLSLGTVEALGEVGVTRIEHLLALPRETLDARFGPDLLRRLDEATGAALEPVTAFRPKAPPTASRSFDGPVPDPRALRIALRILLEDLTEALAREGRGVLRLEVEAARPEAPSLRESLRLARPSSDARHLAALLDPRLDRWHLEPGVERLRLTVANARRLHVEQGTAWGSGIRTGEDREAARTPGADRATAEVVEALASRCGEDAVLGFDLVESHVPERACRARSALSTTATRSTALATTSDRPSLLLAAPEPVDVVALVPDGPPARLRWRGETRFLRDGRGPERIAPPWWEGAPPAGPVERDYFRVQDERGRWLWLFRESLSRRWFVHGEWA